ncbi:MAG: sugar transferase [Verrucomicrobiota bacterium]
MAPPSPTSLTADVPSYRRGRGTHMEILGLAFAGDLIIVALALVAAHFVRFEVLMESSYLYYFPLSGYLGHILFGTILMMVLLVNFRLYQGYKLLSYRRTYTVIGKATFSWVLLYLAISLILKFDPPISRFYSLLGFVFAFAGLLVWRWFFHAIIRTESIASQLRQRAVFVGWSAECERAMHLFGEGRGHPIEIVGVIEPPSGEWECKPPKEVEILGSFENCRDSIHTANADLLIVADMDLKRDEMVELSLLCEKELLEFKMIPSCFQVLLSGLNLESISGVPVLGISKLPLHSTLNHFVKRAVDIVGSIFGLLMSAPIIAIFGLLIYLESPGSVFYRQRRLGRNGKHFDIIKLRSMKLDAEADGKVGWSTQDDPRRLKIGSFMRKWNIDEIPQFWNVLKGDMSLVGPRPERPELIEQFKHEIPHYNARMNIKPGITGWAQVNGLRGDTDLTERVKFDLHYIENWNVVFDFQIMAMTFFKREGAA